MNKIIDLHVHSNFSPDSNQEVSSYFKLANTERIALTDHLDFEDIYMGCDVLPDHQGLTTELQRCAKQYGKGYLVGIEVGYHPDHASRIIDHLRDKHFDVIILSFHQDGTHDYLSPPPGYKVDVDQYLKNIIHGLNNMPFATTLGHLDFPFRVNKLDPQFFNSPLLVEVFKLLITNGIAMELNTRSMYQYRNEKFYRQLFTKYYNAGGRLVSLGSDAHRTADYRFNFEDALNFLSEIGDFELINYRY
ncbi:PHP domain-containing protein [Mollicutes bacterium LVI A0039]|nr:PHP domain-containing protein [Mollicutes bacterium LVI A0039]